jgi:hypothetical protein
MVITFPVTQVVIACPCLPLPAPNSIRGTRFGELDSGNLFRENLAIPQAIGGHPSV